MTPLDAIREAARESRERDCQFLKEPYPALNAIHTHGPACGNPELGQWREAAERACAALEEYATKEVDAKHDYGKKWPVCRCGRCYATFELAAVAELLKGGRG